jgi:hypothetical protein
MIPFDGAYSYIDYLIEHYPNQWVVTDSSHPDCIVFTSSDTLTFDGMLLELERRSPPFKGPYHSMEFLNREEYKDVVFCGVQL